MSLCRDRDVKAALEHYKNTADVCKINVFWRSHKAIWWKPETLWAQACTACVKRDYSLPLHSMPTTHAIIGEKLRRWKRLRRAPWVPTQEEEHGAPHAAMTSLFLYSECQSIDISVHGLLNSGVWILGCRGRGVAFAWFNSPLSLQIFDYFLFA
jgi:hypothetical protein